MSHPALTLNDARRLWLHAQSLDTWSAFGKGSAAVLAAIEQLGYVQIDTISVIERSHHHILYSRIPDYHRQDLGIAQSEEKTVFEYWTHALSYVPTRDFPFFIAEMRLHRKQPGQFDTSTTPAELRRVLKRIKEEGPLTISDFDTDTLKEKEYLWASRKPSKAALQLGFYNGQLVISRRAGMLKTYELTERHFGWERWPAAASPRRVLDYLIDSALRSQGVVNVDSIVHIRRNIRGAIKELLDERVKRRKLLPVHIQGLERTSFWATPAALEELPALDPSRLTHILSPFDPLIIQRKRTKLLFGYEHLFEAYLPAAKRQYGYFTLPVLVGEDIVAMLDLKTDRQARKLRIQSWHWTEGPREKAAIEEALHRFEQFQLQS